MIEQEAGNAHPGLQPKGGMKNPCAKAEFTLSQLLNLLLGTLGVLLHSSSFILQTIFRAIVDSSSVVPYEMCLAPIKSSFL